MHPVLYASISSGDVSSEILTEEKTGRNPDSKLVWEYSEKNGQVVHSSIAGLCVTDKYLFTADTGGFVRCFDKLTGKLHWQHETMANVIGTPLVVGDTLYVADDEGDVEVLRAGATYEFIARMSHEFPIDSSPIYANETLFVVTRNSVFAVGK